MATQPEIPPPSINPQSPPEAPPVETPDEAPVRENPEILPPVPDQDQPGRHLPETPPPPD